jgi:hypothetical protein
LPPLRLPWLPAHRSWQSKLYRFETPEPHSLNGKPPIEVLVPDTSRGGRAAGGTKIWTIHGGHLGRQNAQDGLAMTRRR